MYHFFRRIHLFTGLVLLVFVLMYFVSGYVMIHPEWFGERESKDSTRTEPLAVPAAVSDETLVSYLQAAFDLHGQSGTPEHRKDGSIRINFVRPGTSFQAVIDPARKHVTIIHKVFGVGGLANGMHRLKGYHGGWAYWVWSLLYDSASLALVIFGITGVILWYQSTTKHLAGWACLAASFGFTTAMILYLMLSK
jgi:hypothetical protein